jgi:hypothetical protein
MLTIKRKYIIDESNEKIAVQLDIKTYERIERLLEDYVLGESIKKNKAENRLDLKSAREYYKKVKKK